MKNTTSRVLFLLSASMLLAGCSNTNQNISNSPDSNQTSSFPEVWSTYSSRKVVMATDRNDSLEKMPGEINISLYQGEKEDAQLILTSSSNEKKAYSLAYGTLKNKDGVEFDYSNPEHIKHWKDQWFYKEDPTKLWTPTDVHGATTKAAFDIDETHPDFHRLRYVGKRVNFAKNYGAQYGKICQMFPEYDAERCRKIDAAYYTAFPGVKAYHAYCYDRQQYSYTTNLFGIRYYNVSGHKLINMLVQGSAAFYLKLKIIQLYKYSKEHNLKTRWQMQIHDELSWEHHVDDDPAEFFEFKRIMEDWDEGLVPIVADMEVTTTTWAAKVEVETESELREILNE